MGQRNAGARDWNLPNRVMAIAIAAALLLILASGGLLYYAILAVNGITLSRETRLMERSVERRLARLKDDVASVCVWNDAYELTALRFDREWADVNYGVYFSQYLHHDLSVIVDANDRPIYASVAGKPTEPKALEAFSQAARPLLRQVRARAQHKISSRPQSLGFDRVGTSEGAVRVGDRVYLVSASTVVPEPTYNKVLLAAPGPVVLSGVEINEEYLKNLDADYGLKDAKLIAGAVNQVPSTLLRKADGQVVAAIGWSPERPGGGVYRDAKWWILGFGSIVLGIVALVILRLRAVAQELTTARDRAQAGDRAKSEFIANMSHEIRTPLNGVLGMAQAMEGNELSPDQLARLKVIRESGASLLGVLNDVLDLAKIEAGKLEIEERVFNLEQLGKQVRANFAEVAAAKDLDFRIEVEESDVPAWRGDALRIRQILSNLVSNALKFTARGSVTLAIAPTPAGVQFQVVDTGIGLNDLQLPGLFEKFSQGDASTTRRYGGTGLGLSISKQLVELMGGSLSVTSRVDEGSTFTVLLPLTPAMEALVSERDEQKRILAQPLRILAAEDNLTNQIVLRALIGPLGAELEVVSNGREAVDAVARQSFDLVLMDVQMPEMNGLEAARAIRELEAARGLERTPILALTANVMSHQIDSYHVAGMDGHIAKPIDAAALYAALEATIAQAERGQAAA